MSVPIPGGRENTSTASWSKWPESKARYEKESGSIRRRRRRSFTGSRQRRIFPSTTISLASAYLRAKEDYLMGINFSRLLSLKYGNAISNYLGTRYTVISVGRVMTCVLGMVVRREWEIRNFVKTPFYRVVATQSLGDGKEFPGEFRAVAGL